MTENGTSLKVALAEDPMVFAVPPLQRPSEPPLQGATVASLPDASRATCSAAAYRFLDCLGRTPFGDIWRVEGPDGRTRQARYVGGLPEDDTETLPTLRAQLGVLAQEGLAAIEVAGEESTRLLLVGDLAEQTLGDSFQACRERGLPGIPRSELICHLRTAAEKLDDLAERHGLHHLGLSPQTLVLDGGQLRITEFGLVALLAVPRGQRAGELNPRYSAPEVFTQKDSPSADQYSLAVIFQEMLTGFHPLRVPARQRGAVARGSVKPNLAMLSSTDQQVVGRALHHDPARRFPSCTALAAALAAADRPASSSTAVLKLRTTVVSVPPAQAKPAPPPAAEPAVPAFSAVTELVRRLAGRAKLQEFQGVRYRLSPGEALAHDCCASLPPGVAALKLSGFCQEWRAESLPLLEDGYAFFVAASRSVWQRCLGKQVGLQIDVRLRKPVASSHLTGLGVLLRPVGCSWDQGDQLLRDLGPRLLLSLRTYLQALPERRAEERFPWTASVRIHTAEAGVPPLDVRALDLSLGGLGLLAPRPLPMTHLTLHLEQPGTTALQTIEATVVRQERLRDGGYEIGAVFR